MTTEKTTGTGEEETAITPQDAAGIAGGSTNGPKPPDQITEQEVAELKREARGVVRQLADASGGAELQVADSVANLGIRVQRDSAHELNLLTGRMSDLMTSKGPGADISKSLIDLRIALDQINPHSPGHQNVFWRMVKAIPVVNMSPSALEIVEKVAVKYEPASKQVAVLDSRLREGRAMLVKDNVELRKLYEQAEQQRPAIHRNAYLGELIMGELTQAVAANQDPIKADRLRAVLHDVSIRVQDLRTMDEVCLQFLVSIEMSRQNNTRLGQSVERTLALGHNVVMVGLAIQMALARQKRVLEANQRTREFLGNLVAANAATIKRHTLEIGDAYNSPVVAIEKISQAHADLIEAIEMANRLRDEGIAVAKENIARLVSMSSELEDKSASTLERRAIEPGAARPALTA